MNLQKISGLFIFLSFLISIISYFIFEFSFIFSGIFAWIAFFILFNQASNTKLLVSLLLLSFFCFSFSFFKGFEIDIKRSILVNQYLLSLLIGVGFLRLIATFKKNKIKKLPKGKMSFFKTYLGVHLFGSVINLSALILVADRLYKSSKFSSLQILTLTRAFSTDAYWSPFFVAFAAASTYAPNLATFTILILGLFLAFIGFCLTYFEVNDKTKFDLDDFEGYPINFETLYLPFVLALLVLITHYFYEELKVILLIAMFSFLLTLFILPFKVGIKKSVEELNTHIVQELPSMKNELSLFLVAGMFGVSVSSILVGFNITLPFETFDGLSASILLFVFIVLSFIGIHPIISIAVVGNWAEQLNHTLLAVSFLMAWATSVSTSPFSGLNLTIQARYKLNAMEIFKINLPYAIKMYIISCIILFALANYLGV